MSDEDVSEPLRVSQLDAAELDSEVYNLIKAQFGKVVKYLQPGTLSSYEPEVNAILRAVIWQMSIQAVGSTVGQQMLDLKYKDERQASQQIQWMDTKQKWLFGLSVIVIPWFKNRFIDQTYLYHVGESSIKDKINKICMWLEVCWKCASLMNFLVFLRQGKYQSLLERLLSIRSFFPHKQMVRQVTFEYMNRELLWHGFAEFLFFIMPLVNFRKLQRMASNAMTPIKSKVNISERCQADYEECAVCGHWPNNPHHIGCAHIFCYYCIMSSYEVDASYSCPQCRKRVIDNKSIHPVKVQALEESIR